MQTKLAALAVAALLTALPAVAQQDGAPLTASGLREAMEKPVSPEGKVLGECMIAHSTPEVEKMFKTMLIDALNDNTEGLNKETPMLGISILSIAIQSCGVTATELQSPKMRDGARLYGEAVGAKIMTAAFAKLGQ